MQSCSACFLLTLYLHTFTTPLLLPSSSLWVTDASGLTQQLQPPPEGKFTQQEPGTCWRRQQWRRKMSKARSEPKGEEESWCHSAFLLQSKHQRPPQRQTQAQRDLLHRDTFGRLLTSMSACYGSNISATRAECRCMLWVWMLWEWGLEAYSALYCSLCFPAAQRPYRPQLSSLSIRGTEACILSPVVLNTSELWYQVWMKRGCLHSASQDLLHGVISKRFK